MGGGGGGEGFRMSNLSEDLLTYCSSLAVGSPHREIMHRGKFRVLAAIHLTTPALGSRINSDACFSSVVDPERFFSDPDPTFQLVSDPDPVSDPT